MKEGAKSVKGPEDKKEFAKSSLCGSSIVLR